MAVGDESQADMVEPIQKTYSSSSEPFKQAYPNTHSAQRSIKT